MDLQSVAVELYQLVPDQFTAARNSRAREISAAGDRELASAVQKLPKPSASAWAVNRLSAEVADAKDEFLALAQEWVTAHEHPDRQTLSELNGERKRLVGETTTAAANLADENSVRLSASARTEVEQTFFAAIADQAAAAAVFSGRLVRPLQAIGLDQVDLAGAVGGPDVSPLVSSAVPRRPQPVDATKLQRDRKKARKDAEQAESEASAAEKTVASLDELLEEQDSEAEKLTHEVDQLRAQLEALQDRQSELRARQDEARHQRKTAIDAARRARNAADAAQEHVERLQRQ
jgi:hypothetical protein